MKMEHFPGEIYRIFRVKMEHFPGGNKLFSGSENGSFSGGENGPFSGGENGLFFRMYDVGNRLESTSGCGTDD